MSGMEITEVLGNLGDFIGAIAVFGTIVYLAIQVRHSKESVDANTRALEDQHRLAMAESRQHLLDLHAMTGWDLAQDPALMRAFGLAIRGWPDGMTAKELTAFDLAMTRYVLNTQNGLLLRDAGLLDDQTLARVGSALATFVAAEGFRQWWDQAPVPGSVRNYIEELVSAGNFPPVDQWMPHFVEMTDEPA